MSLESILEKCRAYGITLAVSGEQIKLSGNKAKVTKSLLLEIKNNKSELIQLLKIRKTLKKNKQNIQTFSLSDFPYAKLTDKELEELLACHADVERLYMATPMQEGMLFHGLMDGSGASYTSQTYFDMLGPLNTIAYKKAWQAVVQRHDTLRTCFVGLESEQIHQLVRCQVELPFVEEDWFITTLDSEEDKKPLSTPSAQETALLKYRQLDKEKGFDFTDTPLMRITLIRLAPRHFHFILTHHHAILDGWCLPIIFKEVLQYYQAYLHNQKVALPITVPYEYYIAWLYKQNRAEAVAFWQRHLQGVDAPTPLWVDKLPVNSNHRGMQKSTVALSPQLSEELQLLAKTNHCTINIIVQAAWSYLLHRYSGDSHILFGATISGRPADLPGIEKMLGLFINTIPVRVEFPEGLTLSELLAVLHHDNIERNEYGYLSLTDIHKASSIPNSIGLFDSIVVFENYPTQAVIKSNNQQASDIRIQSSGHNEHTNYGLTLIASYQSELDLTVSFRTEKFAPETIGRLLEHLQQILQEMSVGGGGVPVHNLSLLSAVEQHKLLVEWQDNTAYYSPQFCIHELFEQQVQQYPDNIAISFDDTTLTYQELNKYANRLAHYLIEHSVQADTLVGLCVKPSLNTIIGILGILKAGGAYVPIDPNYPQERIAYILEDSAVSIVLTQKNLLKALPLNQQHVLCLGSGQTDTLLANYSAENIHPTHLSLRPGHLAYIIYTSGTTGLPKGVMVEHYNVDRLFKSSSRHFNFTEQDNWTLFHSFTFDFSVWEIWGALIHGGKLLILPYEVTRSPELFCDVLMKQKVTVLNQTPSAFYPLVRELRKERLVHYLRYVIFGGEALDYKQLGDWFKLYDKADTRLVNMYGITETTVHVTYHSVTGSNTGSIIGKPLHDLQVYLSDKNLQLQAIGVPGELLVSGGGVSRGYLNQDSLTGEKFICNHFINSLGIKGHERIYRSGDLVRWLPNGSLDYLGRIDKQVKVRGFRIELAEIESQLTDCKGVDEVVVLARSDDSGNQADKRLVAYIVPKNDFNRAIDPDFPSVKNEFIAGLQAYLTLHLPAYMVPSVFVLLEKMPLTVNGKIDHKALPVPGDKDIQKSTYVPPSNGIEKQLCQIWQEVLKIKQVGIHDNFFSLGGDSILSIRIVSLAKSRKLAFTVKDLFELQTIKKLAKQIDLKQDATTETTQLQAFGLLTDNEKKHLPDDCEDAYPLSQLQEGMIFHSEMDETGATYHDVFTYHLKCQWDILCFEEALSLLMDWHPVLRTGFLLDSSRALQYVYSEVSIPLFYENIQYLSTDEQNTYITQWVDQEKHQHFNWRGPLFRIYIRRRSNDSFEYSISFHHAILDGFSVATLSTELFNIYSKKLAQEGISAKTSEWIFRDYIAMEQLALANEKAREYWSEMLHDAPVEQIPRKFANDSDNRHDHGSYHLEKFPAVSKDLIKLAEQLGVPIQAVLIAAHIKALATISGHNHVVSCIVHNTRPEQEGGDSGLGLFLNSLPHSFKLHPCSWRQLILQIAQTTTETLQYRYYPLSKIQKDVGKKFSEVIFNYTHFHVYKALNKNDNGSIKVLDAGGFEQINFDFSVEASKNIDTATMNIMFNYNANLFELAFIDNIADYYMNAFHFMLCNPDENHLLQPLLSKEEQQRLLLGWNNTQVNYPHDKTVHELFQEQVSKTPDHIAVVYQEQQLSYDELNKKANRLCHYLLEAGVEVESRVGIYLERSLELLIAVLGVMKAGGSYVPLEPALPEQRIRYMLDDAEIELLITDSLLLSGITLAGIDVFMMDEAGVDESWLEEYECDNADSEIVKLTGDNLLYILYTSGSTGKPKGVMINHNSVGNYLCHARKTYMKKYLIGSVVSSPLCFDATLTTLLTPLCAGKRVELLPDTEDSLSLLCNYLFDRDNSWLFKITPAHLDALAYQQGQISIVQSKHIIVVGGEELKTQTLLNWKQGLLPNGVFVNEYGPTETVVGCSTYIVGSAVQIDTLKTYSGIPIGRAIQNTQLYVLNADRQLQPENCIGELYIGGVGLARAYAGKPELTADKFINNPLSHKQVDRLYKTGDLVRRKFNGDLIYMGRTDDQVKIKGYRIELGEIEKHLTLIDGVREALVLVKPDKNGESSFKKLIAYLVIDENKEKGFSSDLDKVQKKQRIKHYQTQLALQLAEYMVPSLFVFLKEMPLTPNGKVNRNALPEPDEDDLQKNDYVAPRNTIEQQLCDIWQSTLKLSQLGIHDNFFEMGGDSIISIQVVSRARAVDCHFTVRQLFEYQTIAELALVVTTSHQIQALQTAVQGEMPLLPIQSDFFALQLPEQHHYNQSLLLLTPREFTLQQLNTILAAVYQRHDALRLRFKQNKQQWQATFSPYSESMLQESVCYYQFDDYSSHEQKQYLALYCNKIQASLDIQQGPLLKAAFFDYGKDQGRLLLIAHHLVIDGVSWRILLGDLESAFQQLEAGEDIQLNAKTSSYQQWSMALHRYAKSQALRSEGDYWLAQLSQLIEPLPGYIQSSGGQSVPRPQSVSVQLNKTTTQSLLAHCNKVYRTQINELLLSALLSAYKKWSDQSIMKIILEGHGREELFADLDVSETLGWFTVCYPLLLEWPESTDTGDLIKTVKEQYRAVPKHGIGYGVLREILKGETIRELPDYPADSAIVFNYLGQFDNTIGLDNNVCVNNSRELNNSGGKKNSFSIAGESSGSSCSRLQQVRELISINGMVMGGCLKFVLGFDASRITPESVDTFAHSFKKALEALVVFCSRLAENETLRLHSATLTPADFPYAQCTQEELNRLQQQYHHVERLYISTPMQQGMLFHGLVDGTGASYTSQTFFDLSGELHIEAFKKAWQMVVRQHDVLRTCFIEFEGGQLHQLVNADVSLSVIELDWRDQSAEDQQLALIKHRQKDKARGFDFSQAPLMRVTLIRLGAQYYHFLLSHHHVLLDGWCLPLLFHDVIYCYRAFAAADNESPAFELPNSMAYENYIAWLCRQDKDAARLFWQQHLNGISAPTPLMVNQLAGSSNSTTGNNSVNDYSNINENTNTNENTHIDNDTGNIRKLAFSLSKEVSEKLEQLAKKHQCTMNVLVQAAWSYLLHCYSSEDIIVFGSTISGRPADLPGVEKMLGLFINTIPVRASFTEELRLSELLNTLHRENIERDEYGYLSLTDIQSVSDIPHGIGLFDSIVVFENYPPGEAIESGVKQQVASLKIQASGNEEYTNYALTLIAYFQKQLHLNIGYQSTNFTIETIERLSGHLKQIFQGMADACVSSQQKMQALMMLTPEEQQILLMDWNNTAAVYPENQCVHELFEQQANLTPNNIAVVYQQQQLTYQELNTRANQLAHYLLEQGVKPDTIVALCVERCPEMMVGILGILKAGAAYLPLDPDYPQARLDYMLMDSGAAIVITQTRLLTSLVFSQQTVLCLDDRDDQEQFICHSDENPRPVFTGLPAQNLAYIIYTSGSTGVPKGVLIEHCSVRSLLAWCEQTYSKEIRQAVLFSTSICFDLSVFEMWSALISGGKTIIVDNLLSLLQDDYHSPSLINTVPSAIRALIEQDYAFTREVVINLAGEQLETGLVNCLLQKENVTAVYNLYGPSEDTTYTSYIPFTTILSTKPPIGKPVSNTRFFVLAKQALVPIGIPGELYISSSSLARGYLNQVEMTAEKFILKQFSDKPEELCYKTGDLVRWLEDGNMEFIGRVDDQIKIRGFRIELGEIEKHLSMQPGIKAAVVSATDYREETYKGGEYVGGEYEGGDRHLIAYIVPVKSIVEEHQYEFIADIKTTLRLHLPNYMVPSFFILLEALPLTPNGKINRKALPELNNSNVRKACYEAPETDSQRQLCKIWQEVLNVDQVGINDNFFDLGGHSLTLLSVYTKIRRLDWNLTMKDLLKYQTIRELSVCFERQQLDEFMEPLEDISLVAMNQSASSKKIFCIHPGGGTISCYQELAKGLENDFVFYGLQIADIFTDQQMTSMDALAFRYFQLIKRNQPVGPYYLLGWSLGGNLAYDIAEIMQKSGEQIAYLGLLDAFPRLKSHSENKPSPWFTAIKDFHGKKITIDWQQLSRMSQADGMEFLLQEFQRQRIRPEEVEPELMKRYLRYLSNLTRCLDNYVEKQSHLDFDLFQAKSGSLADNNHDADQCYGWSELTSGLVNIIGVEGEHTNMLFPPFIDSLILSVKNRLAYCINENNNGLGETCDENEIEVEYMN